MSNEAVGGRVFFSNVRRSLDEEDEIRLRHAGPSAGGEQMGEMQNSSRTLVGHFALPAGLDLKGRLVINNSKDTDLAMIDHALNELSLTPVLGAQSARGCGEISGTFDITVDGKLKRRVSVGGYEPARATDFPSTAVGEKVA